jgi:putative molybdopterin biosynthesis protein
MRFCGSVDAIRALNEGRCTVAGFHAPLQPDAGTLTARTYKPLLKTGHHKLIGFATREQGWMVAPGNPKNISGWHDLTRADLRLVNRTLGTGTRLLLDQWLQTHKPASLPTGYDNEEPSHSAVATRIASGHADFGLGIASAAQAQKLDFVPLTQENYWLVCLKSALNNPAVIALRQVLQSPEWQQVLGQQTGYRLHDEAGQIQSLKQCLPWWPNR